mmetsp:Transcript_102045/g.173001  ORF Transcript_102045/g.173001 Transcript_102045/m.173001 type:complete len:196 (+) Transcript_102045:1207-1794(+)
MRCKAGLVRYGHTGHTGHTPQALTAFPRLSRSPCLPTAGIPHLESIFTRERLLLILGSVWVASAAVLDLIEKVSGGQSGMAGMNCKGRGQTQENLSRFASLEGLWHRAAVLEEGLEQAVTQEAARLWHQQRAGSKDILPSSDCGCGMTGTAGRLVDMLVRKGARHPRTVRSSCVHRLKQHQCATDCGKAGDCQQQ